MRKSLSLLFLISCLHVSHAQNYYLSSKGNDSFNGRSKDKAWKTVAKLQGVLHTLQPGDSVLLERGSIFRGSLKIESSGLPNKKIYVGAYGAGVNPIIKGSVEQMNWQMMDNNIWFSICDSCKETPTGLFINNKGQPLGRFPNKGYRVANLQKNGSFVDTSIGLLDADWNGAELVVKSTSYILDRFPVTNYRNAVFDVTVPEKYKAYKEEGRSPYFIQNHLATLDSPGEWCFDPREKKIFLYATKSPPSKNRVEISRVNVGLMINQQHDIIIENISFTNFQNTTAQITKSDNIEFRQNEIRYSGINGLEVKFCSAPIVEKNLIADASNDAVVWEKNDNGTFAHNQVLRTGMQPGRGKSGNGAYIAFYAIGDTQDKKNVIQNNVVDSTGYSAIDFRNGSTLVKNNIISNFCLIKDDGGGIYTWTNAYGNNVIEGNIILGRKSPNSIQYAEKSYSYGIYIDDRTRNVLIRNNTIAYCSVAGIFVHNANGVNIDGNKFLGNGENVFHKEKGQLLFRRDRLAPGYEWDIQNITVSKNKFVSTREDQYSIYLNFYKEQSKAIGTFDNNEYIVLRPLSMAAIDKQSSGGNDVVCTSPDEYELNSWQQLTQKDQSSHVRVIANPYLNAGGNLVQNGDMTQGTRSWTIWPSEASMKQDPRTLKTPSLKVDVTSDTSNAMLYYAGLRFKTSTLYRVSFSVKSKSRRDMEFVVMMAGPPYKAISDYRCLSIDEGVKTFSFYFAVNNSQEVARLNFKSNTSFWIDNVTLQEMSNRNLDQQKISLIYNDSEMTKNISVSGLPSIRLPAYGTEIVIRDQ